MRTNRLTILALTGLLTALSGTAMADSTGPTNPVNSNATKLPGTDGAPTTDRNTSNTQGAKTGTQETGTDTKHSKYWLEVVAGDKKTEKKEKTINEPVQFYLSRVRTPFEIVVNEVQKDYIVGYLSAPKQLVTHTD